MLSWGRSCPAACLLAKLSEMEQESAERNRLREGLGHLVPQRPVWRAVTASLVVIAVAGGVIWGAGILSKPPIPAPIPPTIPPPPALQLEIIPAKTVYLPGEDIEIDFRFKNIITESVTVTPFPTEIQITRSRPYEVVRSFSVGSGKLALLPGEIKEYILIWDQRDDTGQQVAPGWHYINVAGITSLCHPARGKFLIQHPQGAMEKTIEVNQSPTVNGITITLKRVELTSQGASFYAFTTPPSYKLPKVPKQGPKLPPPPPVGPAHAQYTVDGVTKDAGSCGIGLQDDGMRLSWGIGGAWLDPVPSDAKELTLTITKFGDWRGPWEFQIPLQ